MSELQKYEIMVSQLKAEEDDQPQLTAQFYSMMRVITRRGFYVCNLSGCNRLFTDVGAKMQHQQQHRRNLS